MSATTATAQPEDENDVLFSQQRGNRTIVLNRPKKLNSLNLSMIDKILPRLKVRFRLSVKSD
jgi:3-hydroxyisobutyryl-CoA hydrolase